MDKSYTDPSIAYIEPSMSAFVFDDLKQQSMQVESKVATTTLVSHGCVNYRGEIADKQTTGGWNASPFVIVNEIAERLAFYAVGVSMVSYLVREMHVSIPTAATYTTDWIGAAFVLTILGAFIADAYLGRFLTIMIFSCVYAVGMVMLTISASIDSLRPAFCTKRPCDPATNGQSAFLFCALALIALGTGGIKPCVSSFGADQFDEADEKEVQKKYAFFNWFFFAINMGAILGITVMVYITQEKGFGWGFAVPTVVMFCSILILGAGFFKYRYKKPMGSPFTRFIQVIVASVRNHTKGITVENEGDLYEVRTQESAIFGAQKIAHSSQYRFLDKAAIISDPESVNSANRWRVCTVTQVEEFKCFIRVLPIWASTIALSISFAQLSTFFLSQAGAMDRKLGSNFVIPSGSIPVFTAINAIILVPIYEKIAVPFLRKKTGHRRGLTSLQRMGVGLFISIFALISAAVIEKSRRDDPTPAKKSVFWLFPQFFLMGSAEVFTYVGQLEFFYDEATEGTKSISSAMFLSEIGIGSWLSTAIVKIIEKSTGGQDKGWLRNDLNTSKLDYLYWILAGINGVNFLVYVFLAWRYKGKDGASGNGTVRHEVMTEVNSPATTPVNVGKTKDDEVSLTSMAF